MPRQIIDPSTVYTKSEVDALLASITTTLAGKIAASIVDAKGDLIVATAADTVARMAVGADGLMLAADSSQTPGLKWVSPAGRVLLATSSPSGGASAQITTRNARGQSGALFQSDYDDYYIRLRHIIPATNNVGIYFRGTVSGSPDTSSKYALTGYRNSEAGSTVTGEIVSAPIGQVDLARGDGCKNTSTYGLCAELVLSSPLSTSLYKRLSGYSDWLANTGTELVRLDISAVYQLAAAMDGIVVLASSGNITGDVLVYGATKT